MKKILYGLLAIGMLCISSVSVQVSIAAEQQKICPDPNCDDPVSQYAQEVLNAQKANLDSEFDKVANVDYTGLDACLSNADDAFNLSGIVDAVKKFKIILPDFGEIVSKACVAVVNELKSQFNKIESNIVNMIPYNGKIDFNDFSQDLANSTLDKVFDPAGTWINTGLDKLPTDAVNNIPGLDDIPSF